MGKQISGVQGQFGLAGQPGIHRDPVLNNKSTVIRDDRCLTLKCSSGEMLFGWTFFHCAPFIPAKNPLSLNKLIVSKILKTLKGKNEECRSVTDTLSVRWPNLLLIFAWVFESLLSYFWPTIYELVCVRRATAVSTAAEDHTMSMVPFV